MTADPPVHPFERISSPSGQLVAIDTEMVPVIRQLWRLGSSTVACCQDVGEATATLRDLAGRSPSAHSDGFIAFHHGYALLKMPTGDALDLAARLLGTPFRERIESRWQAESWRIHVPVIHQAGVVGLADATLIHFPRPQISELTRTLTELP